MYMGKWIGLYVGHQEICSCSTNGKSHGIHKILLRTKITAHSDFQEQGEISEISNKSGRNLLSLGFFNKTSFCSKVGNFVRRVELHHCSINLLRMLHLFQCDSTCRLSCRLLRHLSLFQPKIRRIAVTSTKQLYTVFIPKKLNYHFKT